MIDQENLIACIEHELGLFKGSLQKAMDEHGVSFSYKNMHSLIADVDEENANDCFLAVEMILNAAAGSIGRKGVDLVKRSGDENAEVRDAGYLLLKHAGTQIAELKNRTDDVRYKTNDLLNKAEKCEASAGKRDDIESENAADNCAAESDQICPELSPAKRFANSVRNRRFDVRR